MSVKVSCLRFCLCPSPCWCFELCLRQCLSLSTSMSMSLSVSLSLVHKYDSTLILSIPSTTNKSIIQKLLLPELSATPVCSFECMNTDVLPTKIKSIFCNTFKKSFVDRYMEKKNVGSKMSQVNTSVKICLLK